MGAGKTTYGRRLAKQLDLEFIDLDQYIEKKHKSSIPYIFDLVGETGFRHIEHRTLLEIISKNNFVLSTGGGIPCFNDNMKILLSKGITIYLKLPTEDLVARLKKAKRRRPLIENFSEEELTNFINIKISERKKFYNKADIIIDGSNLKTRLLVDAVNKYIEYKL